MRNKLGFLFLAIALFSCAIPMQGADYATFESFYSSGGLGFWDWTFIIGGTILVAGITFFTFGGGAAAAPAWMATVGGWIGSTVGLSGIAAANFGLALLGGGSIAAGGLGVAGGVSLLSAIMSFGVDYAITYSADVATETWSHNQFVAANKEMLTLPIPRNEKGGKAYKAAVEYLNENFKSDLNFTDPDNQSVIVAAKGILEEKMSEEKDKDYRLKNDVLLALFQLQTNDYLSAWATALNATAEAKAIKEDDSLPSFICGLAALSDPNRSIDNGIMDNLRHAYTLEPKNKLIPIMTGCCMDRIMYRYHYGKISSEHLKDFFKIITDEKLNDEMAAESLNIFLTRCLIELKRTKQDFYIIANNESLMGDKDVVAELEKRYERHVNLISMLQTHALGQVIRLSKKFPKDSEFTSEKLYSLLDSYWRDLTDLKAQITPKTNAQPSYNSQNGQNNQYNQNMYGQPFIQNYPNNMQQLSMSGIGTVTAGGMIPNYYGMYTMAARQGNEASMYHYLGYCYYYGQNVAQSYPYAITYWSQAAQQGSVESQYILGKCYYNGVAVSQNLSEAVRYFQMAANQGHTEAQSALGVCYYYGHGVTRNMYEARRWLSIAANKGDVIARQVMNSIRY